MIESNYEEKRYLVCFLIDDGIPSMKIYKISNEITIEDCMYPESTCLIMLVKTKKELREVYNSFLGIRINGTDSASFIIHCDEIKIEDNIAYCVDSENDELIPYRIY